jgi:NitT/TauT family transport system substrate-binding protein
VKKDSPLHGLKELAGKRVAYTSPGSVSNMVILMALKANGMTPQDVKLIPAGDLGANISALASGAVEAAFTDEMTLSQNEHLIQPIFYVRDVMSPKMMQTVCITTTEFAQAHGDTVRALIAGRLDGLKYLEQHPDESADIVAVAYNNPDKDVFRAEMKRLLAINYFSDGRFDFDAMNHMVEGLQITGQLKASPDWSKMVDTAYLPADQRASR